MFFKCFLELSAALSKNSYQGKVLQKQLKVFSQTSYLRPASGKQKVAATNTATVVCVPDSHRSNTYTWMALFALNHINRGWGGEHLQTQSSAHIPPSVRITHTDTFTFCRTQQRATHFQSQFSTYSPSVTNEDWSYSKVSGLLEDKGKTATEASNLFQTILPPPQRKLRTPKLPKNKENKTEIIRF